MAEFKGQIKDGEFIPDNPVRAVIAAVHNNHLKPKIGLLTANCR